MPAPQCFVKWFGSTTMLWLLSASSLLAQIIPDNTLPVNSSVTPGCVVCVIEGGTPRDVNLYHSFQQFSVPTGGIAYFNNGLQIQNILARITGPAVSNIDGLILANGAANLFLLNPNGIIFGPNAQLQIGGSFFATTASSFRFFDGSEFSAINPQAPPLLTINITPGLQTGAIAPGSTITNRGLLIAGQDLTLESDLLDVQGQLFAGRDLTLRAQNTVQINDTNPFQPFAARTGRNLTIQGNQLVDIFVPNALFQTPFFSGSDTTLISANPILANAYFDSRGNFSTRTLDGRPNDLRSVFGASTFAGGNYTIANYTGPSLLVNAGGNIAFTNVDITDLDPAIEPSQPALILNAGGNITGTGIVQTTVPTGNLLVNLFSGGATNVGQIFTDGGNLSIQAQAGISVGTIDTFSTSGFFGGNVDLFSGDATNVSSIFTDGGNLSIQAQAGISVGTVDTSSTSDFLGGNVDLFSGGATNVGQIFTDGGNVSIQAQSVFLNNANFDTSNTNPGQFAGNIFIEAAGAIDVINSSLISEGNLGVIELQSNQGTIRLSGATLNASNSSSDGFAGDIYLDARRDIDIFGSTIGAEGNIGQIFIGSELPPEKVLITNSTLRTSNIISGSVAQSGLPSGLFTSTSTDFRAGIITINTGTFEIRDGSALSAQSTGKGAGGNILVNAREQFSALAGGQLITTTLGAGNAGNIEVNAPRITIAGQDPQYRQRLAKFPNPVDPGVANAITETGPGSGLFANAIATSGTTQLGNGGNITITASDILLQDNAGLRVGSRSGNLGTTASNSAGSINVRTNLLVLDRNAFISAETDSGNGGNIHLVVRDFLIMTRNSEISATAGSFAAAGNGGNIRIDADRAFLLTSVNGNNDIVANAFGGQGGNIRIKAFQIIGFRPQVGLSPAQLQQIRRNRTSDITASSNVGTEGRITVLTLGIDPSRGLAEFDTALKDLSQQIGLGCAPKGQAAQQESRFTATGRGGVSASPTDSFTAEQSLVQLLEGTRPEGGRQTAVGHGQEPASSIPDAAPIIEAQNWGKAADGSLYLVANSSAIASHEAPLALISCDGTVRP